MAIKPTGEEVEIAQVVTPPPAAELAPPAEVATKEAPKAKMLPDTSTALPLIGLLGLLALGGAAALRFAEKRIL